MKEKVLVARERFVAETAIPLLQANFGYKAIKREKGGQNEGKRMKGYIKKIKEHWYVLAACSTGRDRRAGCVNFEIKTRAASRTLMNCNCI